MTKKQLAETKKKYLKSKGTICPYCGSEDTMLLDDFVDEETNVVSEAWQCGACGSTFGREAKLDKDGRTILYSETHSARYA